MGESSWAVHEAADSVRRLEWCKYSPAHYWQMELSRAVAASACVPLVFEPLRLRSYYEDIVRSLTVASMTIKALRRYSHPTAMFCWSVMQAVN